METYEFTLILTGDITEEQTVKLYDSGWDLTISSRYGTGLIDVTCEAETAVAGISAAIRLLGDLGLQVRRIEPDDLVTIPEIAERLSRTPESIRLLANGERGGGRFPLPVSHLVSRHRLWRWSDVARWEGSLSDEDIRTADTIAAFNALLELSEIEQRDPEMMEHLRLKAL